jgi:phosphate starvation-inducible PhoH-like protein
MDLTEKKLKLENVNTLELLGINDSHLELIQERFDALITIRGQSVIIRGVSSEIEKIEKTFKEMVFILNRNLQLTKKDVETILDIVTDGNENYNVNDDIVLFTKNDSIKARTAGQKDYIKIVKQNDLVFAVGPAGTGKTYLAVAFAVAALKKKEVQKIVLTRPAVEAGESLGFLPGDFREKIDPYLRPLYDALEEMISADKLKTYLEKGTIEIIPLAYMRGRTLNNSYVILDEAQNSNAIQMKMFLTRLGTNSKAIVTGDVTQIDLPTKKSSGLVQIQDVLKGINGVGFIYFEKSDVVRHRLVRDIIDAYEKFSCSGVKDVQKNDSNKNAPFPLENHEEETFSLMYDNEKKL